MSHRTVSVLFDREFRLPACRFADGEVTCRVVRSRCEILGVHCDLLYFRVILVVKVIIRSGGLRCAFERVIVVHDCCWVDGFWVVGCEVERVTCRCRIRRGRVRCAGVAEVRFRVRGGCHCDWESDPCDEGGEWESGSDTCDETG